MSMYTFQNNFQPILNMSAQENWLFPICSRTIPPKWIIKNDVSEANVFNIANAEVTYDGHISFIFANPPLIWSDDIDNAMIAIALAKLRLHPIRKNAKEQRPGITWPLNPMKLRIHLIEKFRRYKLSAKMPPSDWTINSMKIGKAVKYPIVSTSIPEKKTVLFRSYPRLVLIENFDSKYFFNLECRSNILGRETWIGCELASNLPTWQIWPKMASRSLSLWLELLLSLIFETGFAP